VQPLERSETTNGDWDLARHARHDSRVEKDSAAGHLSDIDQLGPFIASPAPTEPQVTNVTSASTACVAIGDDERILVGMLVEPALRSIVQYDGEFAHRQPA
jgi:hypothetical protein